MDKDISEEDDRRRNRRTPAVFEIEGHEGLLSGAGRANDITSAHEDLIAGANVRPRTTTWLKRTTTMTRSSDDSVNLVIIKGMYRSRMFLLT